MLYQQMMKEKQKVEDRINDLQSQIDVLPSGTFFCTRNNKYYKWYYTDKGKTKYIPKSERKLAEQLVKRKYLESRLRKFKQEEKRIDIYLKQYSLDEFSSYHVEEHPELQKLLSGVYVPLKQELDEWVNASYTNNPKEPQKLIHKTIPGILVRSKSEALIINALFGHKIPFRYECLLQIQNVSIYPDFTIRHPVTGEVYYWEHFGMMDNENYAHNVYSKLQLYQSVGIIPSMQLLTTFETRQNPLDYEYVELLIQYYFT